MTIEIVEAELQITEDIAIWACWLEISQGTEAYLLPATASGELVAGELQAHFEAQETELFSLAQSKGFDVDQIYARLTERILKAFALVVLDEINLLRAQHSLTARTATQLRTAVKNKLKSL